MALTHARYVAEALSEDFARGCWHEDETVYARFQDISRRVVQDVVQSGLICHVSWSRVPSQSFLDSASWKWWCWIPEPLFLWIDKIPRLKEWLLWEVYITRQQLLWMEAFMADYKVKGFSQILVLKTEAAAYVHMRSSKRKQFFKQLKDACQVRDALLRAHGSLIARDEAPALGEEAMDRREAALQLQMILK